MLGTAGLSKVSRFNLRVMLGCVWSSAQMERMKQTQQVLITLEPYLGTTCQLCHLKLGNCCRAGGRHPPKTTTPFINRTYLEWASVIHGWQGRGSHYIHCQLYLFTININQCPISAGGHPENCQDSSCSWTCPSCCHCYQNGSITHIRTVLSVRICLGEHCVYRSTCGKLLFFLYEIF